MCLKEVIKSMTLPLGQDGKPMTLSQCTHGQQHQATTAHLFPLLFSQQTF